MKPNEANYIYPPRAQNVIHPNDSHMYQELGWWCQLKYNDTRTLIKITSNNTIELWNRRGEQLKTYTIPNTIKEQLNIIKQLLNIETWGLIDGGLLHTKHTAIKNTIVIWDILVLNGTYLLDTTYKERYQKLKSISSLETYNFNNIPIGLKITNNIIIPDLLTTTEAWNIVHKINEPYEQPIIEGIVLKDPNGTLGVGYKEKNNGDWMVRSRVQTKRHLF